MEKFGADFLKNKYDLHNAGEVKSAAKRKEIQTQKKVPQNTTDQIGNYLDRFNEILVREDPEKRERGIRALKKLLHQKFVIKPKEVPGSVFSLEQDIARELGHGTIEITEEFKERKIQQIINDQTGSLDRWINYLSSTDALYPDWAKYWVFRSMLEMGKLQKEEDKDGKEKIRFKKRTQDTVASFAPLNERALALTIGVLESRLKEKEKPKNERNTLENKSIKLSDPEFLQLLSTENFSKIYTQFLSEIPEYSTEGLQEIRGMWVMYPKGSDANPLVKSLEEHPLEWCTANFNTAQAQLEGGNFHVYYSFNQYGQAIIPRVAIRMEGDKIAEVRGIASNQNLDPYISPVVQEKMKEFPDGALCEKKAQDMKTLTLIENKTKKGDELSKIDLVFLYEINARIEGFGYGKDPRIEEIWSKRNVREDLVFVLDIPTDKISLTKEEALKGDILFHYGDLSLGNLTSTKGLTLPKSIGGGLRLDNLTSAEDLIFPQSIGGYIDLQRLTSAKGLTLPQFIGGSLNLYSLNSAKGLTLPKSIGGGLYLNRLTSAKDLTLPQSIGGDLELKSLASAEGLTLPQSIGGDLNLQGLTSADGLIIPEGFKGKIYVSSLMESQKELLRKKYPNVRFE